MAVTALYRLSSNEVVKVSTKGQPFDDRDPSVWGVLTDPVLIDGSAVRDVLPNGLLGPERELGFAKIAVPVVNTVRNATQPEIETFAPAEQADEAAQDALAASDEITQHPRRRKVLKALLRRVLTLHNRQAMQLNALRASIASASSLAQIRSAAAALEDVEQCTDVSAYTGPDFTFSQAVNAVSGDVDPNE